MTLPIIDRDDESVAITLRRIDARLTGIQDSLQTANNSLRWIFYALALIAGGLYGLSRL
jgi:hypothetical protein